LFLVVPVERAAAWRRFRRKGGVRGGEERPAPGWGRGEEFCYVLTKAARCGRMKPRKK
jgi:hypothetical protein